MGLNELEVGNYNNCAAGSEYMKNKALFCSKNAQLVFVYIISTIDRYFTMCKYDATLLNDDSKIRPIDIVLHPM